MKPTPEQLRTIVDTVRQYGLLALAASNAGMSPGALRRLLQTDADLAAEIDDAMDLFRDALSLEILDRAVRGKSDTMLKLAAESFNPAVFKQAAIDPRTKNKPTGLVLRTFDADGEEVVAEKQQPIVPLRIDMERGL